jgi:hypothetical protein
MTGRLVGLCAQQRPKKEEKRRERKRKETAELLSFEMFSGKDYARDLSVFSFN